MGNTKKDISRIYSALILIKSAIIPERKCINIDDIIEVIIKSPRIFLLNNLMLFHLPCFAKEAINRMSGALNECVIEGIKTAIPFQRQIFLDENFKAGNFVGTGIVHFATEKHLRELLSNFVFIELNYTETTNIIPKPSLKLAYWNFIVQRSPN